MAEAAGRRIFVVDDDASVADAVSAVLRQTGFEVSTFDTALLAAQHARRSAPDVVVTDFSMPDINGLMLTSWLQEYCPGCKVVILTGEAAAVAAQAIVGLRFTLLEKPATPSELIDAVQGSGSLVEKKKPEGNRLPLELLA